MRTRSIAVTGLTQSGKTCLITSLINHLQRPPRPEWLSNGVETTSFEWTESDDGNAGRRRYVLNRQKLQRGEFPEKSLATETFECLLKVKFGSTAKWWPPGRKQTVSIQLTDLPGERMADLLVAKHRSFADWCKELCTQLELDETLRRCGRSVLSAMARPQGELGEDRREWLAGLEARYRSFLANAIDENHPFITPSSALLDANGQYVPQESRASLKNVRDWLEKQAQLGAPGWLLVPLPEELAKDKIYEAISYAYQVYREEVVLPALRPLAESTDLVVLVDIAQVLEKGPAWCNANERMLETLAAFVHPGGWARRLARRAGRVATWGWVKPSIERLHFVATQADRVAVKDRTKLKGLLQDLVKQAAAGLDMDGGVSVSCHAISAIDSTEVNPTDPREVVYKTLAEDNQPLQRVIPPELPEEFPGDWDASDYRYPRPAPHVPQREANPPRSFGLDRLARHVLGFAEDATDI